MKSKPTSTVNVKSKHRLQSNTSMIAVMMIACTLAVVLSFVFSKQLVGDLRFNNRVISAKNKVNATLKKNVETIPELKQNFEDMLKTGPQPKDVLSALPTKPDFPALAGEYESMAAVAGVQLIGITAEETESSSTGSSLPAPQEVRFRVTATGSFGQLQQLIKNIELADRPATIRGLAFSGSDPSVILELELTTFFQNETIVSDETETIR